MKNSGKLSFLVGPLSMLAIVSTFIFSTCDLFSVPILINTVICTLIMIPWLLAGALIGRLFIRGTGSLFITISRIAIGIGILGLLFHLLGLAGGLNSKLIISIVSIGFLVELYFLIQRFRQSKPNSHTAGWLLLAVPLAMAIVCVSFAPGFTWKPLDPHPYDVMSYHLQVPREWYDAGKIIPLTHNAFSYFPMLMETHYLSAMHVMGGPWNGMYLCQFISLSHLGLLVCAVAGFLLERGATKFFAWSAALMTGSIPWSFMLGTVCYVEPGVMLYGTLGIGWIISSMREKRGFVIAGLFLGLASGFKYTAFAMTLLPACLCQLILGFIAGNKRWIAGSISSLVIAILIASPWLIRNVAWTGNPVFPLMTNMFGKAHFTDDQVDRYQAAHRPPDNESDFVSRVKNGAARTIIDPQMGYLLIPATVIGLCFGLRQKNPSVIYLTLVLAASTIVWLMATHVMPRFLSPIIPLLVILIFLSFDGSARIHRLFFPAICITQSIIGLAWLGMILPGQIEKGRQGLFLLPDYTDVFEDVARARSGNQTIDLIGDAQAFFYVIPSRQLRYRSVFDVNIAPGQSLVDGWLGNPVEELRRRGDLVIIRQEELDRLSGTYQKLSGK